MLLLSGLQCFSLKTRRVPFHNTRCGFTTNSNYGLEIDPPIINAYSENIIDIIVVFGDIALRAIWANNAHTLRERIVGFLNAQPLSHRNVESRKVETRGAITPRNLYIVCKKVAYYPT